MTFEGEPYKIDDISFVKYIITNPNATLVGNAVPVRDGEWRIVLSPEETSTLASGTLGVDVIVVSKLVGLPTAITKTTTIMNLNEYIMSKIAEMRAEYETEISSLEATIESLNSNISTLTSTVNMLTGLAAVALIIAIVAVAIPFFVKKK